MATPDLKEFLSAGTQILPLSLLVICAGVYFFFRKKNGKGITLILIGVLSLYCFSLFPVAGFLLKPLQVHYTRYIPRADQPNYIVVLGGWHKTNKQIPLSSQLGDDSLKRIVEAVILYYQNPESKLILSGGPPEGESVSNAEMMARFAEALNVRPGNIVVMPKPTNTMEEARMLKPLLEGKRFVLVTSAFHMNRALKLFTSQGLNPIPAPVDFKILSQVPFSLKPSAKALQTSQTALHEYLGLLWAWVKKKFT